MSYPPNSGNWNQGQGQPQPAPQAGQFPQQQQHPQQQYLPPQGQPQYAQPQHPQHQYAQAPGQQQFPQPQQPYYPPRATQVGAAAKPKKGPLRAIVAITITVISSIFLFKSFSDGLGSINLLSTSPFSEMLKWGGVGLLAIGGCVVGFIFAVLSFLRRRPKIIASVAVGLAVLLPFVAFFLGVNSGSHQLQEHVLEIAEMGPERLDNLIEDLRAQGHDVTIIETVRDELERNGLIDSSDS